MKTIVSSLYFDSIRAIQSKCVVLMSHVSGSYFFGAMKQEIERNVKGEISDIIKSNFTTTGQIESLLSAACVMHTFQGYFTYERVTAICGIRQVHFIGECSLKISERCILTFKLFLLSWTCKCGAQKCRC